MNIFLLYWNGDVWNIPKSNSNTRHVIFLSFDTNWTLLEKQQQIVQDLFTNLTIFILGKTGFTNVEIIGKLIQTSSGLVIGTRNPRSKSSLLQNLKKCKRPYFSSQYFFKYLARTYLQPHYGNGVFDNVYLSAGQH